MNNTATVTFYCALIIGAISFGIWVESIAAFFAVFFLSLAFVIAFKSFSRCL